MISVVLWTLVGVAWGGVTAIWFYVVAETYFDQKRDNKES